MTHIVGGGNTSAVHPAFFQNLMMRNQMMMRSRIIVPPEPQLQEIVHEVIAATTDHTHLQQVIEELQALRADLAADRAEVKERAKQKMRNGPYSSVLHRMKPENKDQWYSLIDMLVTILVALLTLLAANQQSEQLPTRDQEQQVIEHLKQINEQVADNQEEEEEIEQLKEINEQVADDNSRDDAAPQTKKHTKKQP